MCGTLCNYSCVFVRESPMGIMRNGRARAPKCGSSCCSGLQILCDLSAQISLASSLLTGPVCTLSARYGCFALLGAAINQG